MEHLAGVDDVGVAEAVALRGRLPSSRPVNGPQALACCDHVGRADSPSADVGGRGASVADALTRPDPVDVAARHAPCAGRRAAGTAGDRSHGVAGADHYAVAGIARWRRDATAGQSPVDDGHDLRVAAAEQLAALRVVAVLASDHGRGECVRVGDRGSVGLVVLRRRGRVGRDGGCRSARVLRPSHGVAVEPVDVCLWSNKRVQRHHQI